MTLEKELLKTTTSLIIPKLCSSLTSLPATDSILGCLSLDSPRLNSLSVWNAGLFSVPHEELENTHDASAYYTKQEQRITIDAINLDQLRSALGLL